MMEELHLFISAFLILWKFEGLYTQNVSFYDFEKSWEDAADFCLRNGGVLESNVTLLAEHLTHLRDRKDIWLGKVKLLTQWTCVRGCFYIYGDFQHFEIEPFETAEIKCQMLCNKYKFYSIKRTDCLCIGEVLRFHRANNCNCVGCYKVWEQLPNFGSRDSSKRCIVATGCDNENLKLSEKECKENYNATCDNGAELGYQKYENYQEAANECERQGSFIKWYPDNFCVTHTLKHQYWTSGRRHKKTFLLKKSDNTETLQPLECFKLDDNGEEEQEDCDKDLPFFCNFGSDEDRGDIISIPNLSIPQQESVQSDDSGGIAAGTVTSIVVVIAVISILIFIHRRRFFNNNPQSHESQKKGGAQDTQQAHINNKSPQFTIYHEIEVENCSKKNGKLNISHAVNNKTYDHVNSNQTNLDSKKLNTKVVQEEYGMAKIISLTVNSSEVAMSCNYGLANQMSSNTEEESDPYAINRDYDHVNNIKRKEDPITKVYDHLPTIVTEDPTYDHSNLKIVSDNEDYYDHFKIDGAHA